MVLNLQCFAIVPDVKCKEAVCIKEIDPGIVTIVDLFRLHVCMGHLRVDSAIY